MIDATFNNIINIIGSRILILLYFSYLLLVFSIDNFERYCIFRWNCFSYILTVLFGKFLNGFGRIDKASLTCDMFNFPGINVNYPNFSTVISFYTLVYLVIPMIENSQFNPSVVIILTILSFISAYNQKEKYCTDLLGIFLRYF